MNIKQQLNLPLNPHLSQDEGGIPNYIQYSENQNWLVIGNVFAYYLFNLKKLENKDNQITGYYTFNKLTNIDKVIPCNDGSVWIYSNSNSKHQTLVKKSLGGKILEHYISNFSNYIWGDENYIAGYDQITPDFFRIGYYENMTKIKAQINLRDEPIFIYKVSSAVLVIISMSFSQKKQHQIIKVDYWNMFSNSITHHKEFKNHYISKEIIGFSIDSSKNIYHAIRLNNGDIQIHFLQGYLIIDKNLNPSFIHERISFIPWKYTSKQSDNHVSKRKSIALITNYCQNIPDTKAKFYLGSRMEEIPLTATKNSNGYFLIKVGEIEYIDSNNFNNSFSLEQEGVNINKMMYIITHGIDQHYNSLFFIANLVNLLPDEKKLIRMHKDYYKTIKKCEKKIIKGLNEQTTIDNYFQTFSKQSEEVDHNEFLELWRKFYLIYPHLPELTIEMAKFIPSFLDNNRDRKRFLGIIKTALDQKNCIIFERIFNNIKTAKFEHSYEYRINEISFLLEHARKPIFTLKQLMTVMENLNKADNLLINLVIQYLAKFNLVNRKNYKEFLYRSENTFDNVHLIQIIKMFNHMISINSGTIDRMENIYSLQSLYYLLIEQPMDKEQSLFFHIASIIKPMSSESNLVKYLFQANSKRDLLYCIKDLSENDNFSYLLQNCQKLTVQDEREIIVHFSKYLLQNNPFNSKYMQWYCSYILIVILNRFNLTHHIFYPSDKTISDSSASKILTDGYSISHFELLLQHLNYGFELGEYERILTLKLLQTYSIQTLRRKETSQKEDMKLDALLKISLRDLFMNSLI